MCAYACMCLCMFVVVKNHIDEVREKRRRGWVEEIGDRNINMCRSSDKRGQRERERESVCV